MDFTKFDAAINTEELNKAIEDFQKWINENHMVSCLGYDDPTFHIERR